MKKITIATLEYRDHVPYGWIATEFCHLNIMGINDAVVDMMEEKWHNTEFEKYNNVEPQIKELVKKQEILKQEIEDLDLQYKAVHKWWKIPSAMEKSLKRESNEKSQMVSDLETTIESLKDERWYDASELHQKATKLLVDNGFILTSKTASGSECITHTEIWQRED